MPSAAVQRIEAKYSLFKAGFGMVSCSGIVAAFVYGLVVAANHADVRQAISWGWGGLAALLALAAGYGLQYYMRRLLDRSAKLVMNEQGMHDLRRPDPFVAWAEIREVSLRGLRRNGVVERASLTLVLHSGKCRTMDVEGLDQTPEYLAAIARSRIAPAGSELYRLPAKLALEE